ncbi:peptidoglycan DD-metalloendopeptidase family protein [Oceanicoccus sp. KOV_DT_Chl]|uniref:peptidoglycan DD-metalloendopeptidase family protein n=1 Tax=Oceanicoccus sp. KOV_DT_Chl TaxID=1904639 RepID=UPI000C7D8D95|nr:peptidoglycan DD-metalloendopeptidase family protein [Oceanicoccus sp. KOV_DT_Chl]
MKGRDLQFLLLILISLVFAGCTGGGQYAPVVEAQDRPKPEVETHIVSRGETLYSLAWRYNLDFRGLASTNGVSSPYTIYPGQKILLADTPRAVKSTSAVNSVAATNTSAKSQNMSAKSAPLIEKTTTTKVSSDLTGLSKKDYPFVWRWPARGKVVRAYSHSSNVHKGIDIHGKLGEPVHAANSGKVVYAGSGLVGYGKLLIIKHDDHYLSAYGHNSQLLVKEGSLIKVGQQIAKFGDTGTDKVKLHFEIRRDGKPINPLGLLPK